MKKLILLFLAAAQIGTLTARQSNADKPYLTKSFNAGDIRSVKAETSGGSITVTGGNENEARVEVYIRSNGSIGKLSDDEIKARLEENYDLNVSVSGGELQATAAPKNSVSSRRGLSISFKFYVPANVSSNLRTSGGSISLTGLKGNEEFKTSGGSLHIESTEGTVDGKTSGGSIHVSNSKGNIDLKTSGGSIDAENCSGTLNLATSGGSLNLKGLGGNIDARTSGGSVKGNQISGSLNTHTSGGSIKLERLSCNLDASTSAGSVYISFTEPGKSVKINISAGSATLVLPRNKGMTLDLSGQKVNTGALNNFNGTVEKNKVKGSLNGGGSDISVHATAGSVSLEWD